MVLALIKNMMIVYLKYSKDFIQMRNMMELE